MNSSTQPSLASRIRSQINAAGYPPGSREWLESYQENPAQSADFFESHGFAGLAHAIRDWEALRVELAEGGCFGAAASHRAESSGRTICAAKDSVGS